MVTMKRSQSGIPSVPSWFLDTNVLDAQGIDYVFECHRRGWVALGAPDTVLVEILQAKDETKQVELLDQLFATAISAGPLFLDSSSLGYSHLGTVRDRKVVESIHSTLWALHTLESDSRAMSRNKHARSRVRDSLIVANSIRSGAEALITLDGPLTKNALKLLQFGYTLEVFSVQEAVRRLKLLVASQPSNP